MEFTHTHTPVQPPKHSQKTLCDLDYAQDPPRILSNYLVHAPKPFNAEPHLPLLVNSGTITPADVFFKRNHGPIPNIRLEDHQVYIGIQTNELSEKVDWKVLNMQDLMTKWPKATITASLQVSASSYVSSLLPYFSCVGPQMPHSCLIHSQPLILIHSAPETEERASRN